MKSSDRLVQAYQKGLLTLPQLRQRMPELRKQAQAVESELQSLEMAAVEDAQYLCLAENLATFRSKLRVRAETLEIRERQQILRLLVKEILVGPNTITIRHSIPIPSSPAGSHDAPTPVFAPSAGSPAPSCLLRKGSHHSALRNALLPRRLQQHVQKPQDRIVIHSPRHLLQHDMMFHRVKVGPQIKIDNVALALQNRLLHALDSSVR